jgi:acyl-coenzyme A thioesterase PaaI-like protein
LTSETTRSPRTAIATSTGKPARPVIETPTGRFEFAEHNCFACGTLNSGGLGLALHVEPGRSWTELALDRRFEGWANVIHGGILCTILDEVMAWALVGEDNWGLTASMAVRFRRPITVGQRIRAEGWITRSRRRTVETASHILDTSTGEGLASATGVYIAADEQRKADLRRQYGFRPAAPPEPVDPSAW